MNDTPINKVEDLELRVILSSALNGFVIKDVVQEIVTKSQLSVVPIGSLHVDAVPMSFRPDDCKSSIFAKIEKTDNITRVWPVLTFGFGVLINDTDTVDQLVKRALGMSNTIAETVKAAIDKARGSKIYVLKPMTLFLEQCYFAEPSDNVDKIFLNVYMDAAVRSWKPLIELDSPNNKPPIIKTCKSAEVQVNKDVPN